MKPRRILAVDPGDKRIGLALSDPSGTIATPLLVLKHVQRLVDAAEIVRLAQAHGVDCIVMGEALDEDGNPGPQARKAARLADAIRTQTDLPVVLWDESGSTAEARAARLAVGAPRSKRKGHFDALAAAVTLQSYLDALDTTAAVGSSGEG